MEVGVGTHLAGMNNFLLLATTPCQSESGASQREVTVAPTADMAAMKMPAPTQKAEFTDGFRLMGNVMIGAFYFLPVELVALFVIWLVKCWRRQKQQDKASVK